MSKITDLLRIGSENAISMADLSALANVPERELRREIMNARIAGNLIVSNENGYFLPGNPDEIISYIRQRKAFIRTASIALAPFIKAVRAAR